MTNLRTKKVCVVVLGDIGRSPRMQYHSLSLAEAGYKVDIVGYEETKINPTIIQHSNIHIHPLMHIPFGNLPRQINYIFKTIWQIITLFCALIFKQADYVLVQNPPAVPTFFVCAVYSFLTRAQFIIDWHNYAYSIMAMTNSRKGFFVNLTKWMESYFGNMADHNICVTEAMKNDLKEKWGINAVLLYDKPASIFHPIEIEEKHEFLLKFSQDFDIVNNDIPLESVFTFINSEGKIEEKKDRPALLISSTSWTEDEDFEILLLALKDYDASYENGNVQKLPKLICAITGKGPLKAYYKEKISKMNMKNITIITPWLEAKDYPTLLASADLGVCLHTSSSGFDLPMKVVDMFGCCLPVCAIDFNCLHELVKNNKNSFTFKTSSELTTQLMNWFEDFPNNTNQQQLEKKFKNEIRKFQSVRWEENWKNNVLNLFK